MVMVGSDSIPKPTERLTRMTTNADYDEGFLNGVAWCARILRLTALEVERPKMGTFPSGDTTILAVEKSGRHHFAGQLRSIAGILETTTKEEMNAKSEQTSII